MPSASTAKPVSASAAMLSSLCERTDPGSVAVTTSRTVARLVMRELQSDIDYIFMRFGRGATAAARNAGADCPSHFIAGLITVFGPLGERFVDDIGQTWRQARIDCHNVDVRFIGDLEHELRHRFALERPVAAGKLIQRDAERKQVRPA